MNHRIIFYSLTSVYLKYETYKNALVDKHQSLFCLLPIIEESDQVHGNLDVDLTLPHNGHKWL